MSAASRAPPNAHAGSTRRFLLHRLIDRPASTLSLRPSPFPCQSVSPERLALPPLSGPPQPLLSPHTFNPQALQLVPKQPRGLTFAATIPILLPSTQSSHLSHCMLPLPSNPLSATCVCGRRRKRRMGIQVLTYCHHPILRCSSPQMSPSHTFPSPITGGTFSPCFAPGMRHERCLQQQ